MDAALRDDLRETLEELRREGKVLREGVALIPANGWLEDGLTFLIRRSMDTVFPPDDHRRHRPRAWLTEGIRKIETLRFLESEHGVTLGQVASQWLLGHPKAATVPPKIYGGDQLREFAGADEKPRLTAAGLARIRELCEENFGVATETTPALPA